MGPDQRLAITTHKVGKRITDRDNSINVWWTPAHQGVEDNEAADTWAKTAAEGALPGDDPTFLRDEPAAYDEKSGGGQSPANQGRIAERVGAR